MNHGHVEQIGTPEAVYDEPKTPFVYSFLGSVNLFHGRVRGKTLQVGGHTLELDQHTLDHDAPAIGYVRPHEIDVARPGSDGGGLPARVRRVLSLGPSARVELVLEDDGQLIEAELGRERVRELNLQEGEIVLVRPVSVRVFPTDQVGNEKSRVQR
jgi:sulfate/thiosulfate transport system ATP-binding protein